jgi:hypothetical protein
MEKAQKKRDEKAKNKALSKGSQNKNAGTVDFVDNGAKKGPKGAKPKFDKKKFTKGEGSAKKYQKGDARKFQKGEGGARKFSKGKENSTEKSSGDKEKNTKSQVRREKQKVSDLIKKLRINYNKLMMKKKDFEGSDEKKSNLVKECIDTIGDKFKDLIFKHDGCRILQALIKHGSSSQKSHVIENIKEHIVELMS